MSQRGRARLLRGGILVLWLVLLGLLIRFEVFPEIFTHTLPGYRSLLDRDVLMEDSWMRILYKAQPIGYSHTTVEIDEANPLKHYTMASRVFVRLKAMGLDQPIYVDTTVYVDVTHRLQGFAFGMSAGDHEMQIHGVRADRDGSDFDVVMKGGAAAQKLQVDIPDDVILYSPMTEMALKRLRPGGELTIRTFDPASLSPSRLTVRALREEPFTRDGKDEPAVLLETDYQGMKVHSWVARDGTLLRQETPLGWTIEACTAEAALDTMRQSASGGDWVADFAVRPKGEIAASRDSRLLRLRLTGVDLTAEELGSNRQTVEAVAGTGIDLTVRHARYPTDPEAMRVLSDDERAAALAATPFVQAEAPELVAKARDITAGVTNDADKARAIQAWVHDHVKKEMTISLPSALDVLQTMAGDCNEHTYLFTALARAAGVPAKIMVGLAYSKGAFYYHAWPAVFVGEWVEVDPTWGQETVDATHIRFTEGELDKQVDIIKFVGRLRIEVLEAE